MVVACAVALFSSGCSLKKLALEGVADSFGASSGSFASDDDPELVREALPFALKTIESLITQLPEKQGLYLSACEGFTQYAYAFIQSDADYLEDEDYEKAEKLRARALKLFLRARDYGLRGLELDYEGISDRLIRSPAPAAGEVDATHLDLLFWTGAAWGAAVSLGQSQPEIVADLGTVKAIMDRCLALEEDYDDGAIHGVLISLEALPETMGGSPARAREHFARAVELSQGNNAGPYITLAETICVAEQNREEFERLLAQALQVDTDAVPALRLQNILSQERARWLLDRVDYYFLDDGIIEEEGNKP
jgi:predicted anti-sigma-YlaC factor YlaD